MGNMVDKVAMEICRVANFPGVPWTEWRQHARAAIEAMRELPEEPGPLYTAGWYSRLSQAAMVSDALSEEK